MRMQLLKYNLAAVLFVVLGPFIIDAQLSSQDSTTLPAPPTLAVQRHAVPKGYVVEFGPFSIQTGDEYGTEESRNETGIRAGSTTTRIWFASHLGRLRYYSADHTSTLWEAQYTDLKLVASLYQD